MPDEDTPEASATPDPATADPPAADEEGWIDEVQGVLPWSAHGQGSGPPSNGGNPPQPPPGPGNGDGKEQALKKLERVKYMLDDELERSRQHIVERGTKISMVAVLAGLGLAKIIFDKKSDESALFEWLANDTHGEYWATGFLFVGAVVVLFSVMSIALERDWVTERLRKFKKGTLEPTFAALESIRSALRRGPMPDPVLREPPTSALSVLEGKEEELRGILALHLEWIKVEIDFYVVAYIELRERNERVRRRIRRGTRGIIIAASLVFAVYGSSIFLEIRSVRDAQVAAPKPPADADPSGSTKVGAEPKPPSVPPEEETIPPDTESAAVPADQYNPDPSAAESGSPDGSAAPEEPVDRP